MELIIPIFSLLLSIAAFYITSIPIRRKYLSKKEIILLTVAESKRIDTVIRLIVVYTNNACRDVLITNSWIQLSDSKCLGAFVYDNKEFNEKWITPINLKGKEHSSVILECDVNWEKVKSKEIIVYVKTNYINSSGIKCCDSFKCGILEKTQISFNHITHQLEKEICGCSMKI